MSIIHLESIMLHVGIIVLCLWLFSLGFVSVRTLVVLTICLQTCWSGCIADCQGMFGLLVVAESTDTSEAS